MIRALLARPAQRDATWLTTTVTDDNDASWALFRGLARDWDAPLERSVLFDRDVHFAGAHATEYQARSEEHTSELQSLMRISYAVFCLKKQKQSHSRKHTR